MVDSICSPKKTNILIKLKKKKKKRINLANVTQESEDKLEGGLPPRTMLRPKKRMMRHKSQPRPVLSGQLTVMTVASPSFSGSLIITTSSCSIPMIFFFLCVLLQYYRTETREKQNTAQRNGTCLVTVLVLVFRIWAAVVSGSGSGLWLMENEKVKLHSSPFQCVQITLAHFVSVAGRCSTNSN